jgi:hypothetical protein
LSFVEYLKYLALRDPTAIDIGQTIRTLIRPNVRFGSKADICAANSDVRFTPDSDRKSGFPQKVMSALPPKADMCGATRYVRFGPKAIDYLTCRYKLP